MKKTYIVLLSAFAGLLGSCSSEDVKSGRNYIEKFVINDIKPIKITIKNDQNLIDIQTYTENYNTLIKKTAPDTIGISENAVLSDNGKNWYESGFLYTVTAENGETRDYSVKIDTTVPKKYSFETWDSPKGYYIPSDSNSRWTSGNEGISWFFLSQEKDNTNPEDYPTRKTTDGYVGNAVLLETIAGGTVPGLPDDDGKKPLFSGNLILGNFNMRVALANELAAIEIGIIYPAKPRKVIGYYKYKEGDSVFISGKNAEPKPGRPDSCSMIIKFYKSNLPDGRDTTLTVENIDESDLVIAETRKEDCSATEGDGFHRFELELEYKPGKEYDPQNRYNLGMTFAASKDGDTFSGKIGSRLIVDEIEIIDF